jgi:predicted small lipoprotein YifL
MNVHTGRFLCVILALVTFIGLTGAISACGKKGSLDPPPNKEEIKRP